MARNALIRKLLDDAAAENAARPQFQSAMSRDQVERVLDALLWLHGCRSSDAGAIYAYDALMRALGIDWTKSTIVRLSDAQLSAP